MIPGISLLRGLSAQNRALSKASCVQGGVIATAPDLQRDQRGSLNWCLCDRASSRDNTVIYDEFGSGAVLFACREAFLRTRLPDARIDRREVHIPIRGRFDVRDIEPV